MGEREVPYSEIVRSLERAGISWVIFDVGGVFVRLRAEVARRELAAKLSISEKELAVVLSAARPELDGESLLGAFGIGRISTESFVDIVIREGGGSSEEIIAGHLAELAGEDPEMVDFLAGLTRYFPIACFSNTNKLHWDFLLETGVAFPHFRHVMASHIAGLAKPTAQAFQYMCSTVGAPIERCLFIDDRAENIEGARNSGGVALQFFTLEKLIEDLLTLGAQADKLKS